MSGAAASPARSLRVPVPVGFTGSLLAFLVLVVPFRAECEPSAASRPLPAAARKALAPLGDGVVGEALPAAPITDPSRLRHLQPGVWTYRILEGAGKGGIETLRVEVEGKGASGEAVELVYGSGEVQHLRVTHDHEVEKLSQLDADSARLIVYRPGLVLESRMRVGESKRVETDLTTRREASSDKVEYTGQLDYTITYVGAYRVTAPAGGFDARLLRHEYEMTVGPATAQYWSYGFYSDDVGLVAEVSEEKIRALFVYRRSNRQARVLEKLPEA